MERHGVAGGAGAAGLEQRLEVAGQQAVGPALGALDAPGLQALLQQLARWMEDPP